MTEHSDSSIPGLHRVHSYEYGSSLESGNARKFYEVDPAPLANYVAAAIGLRDDLHECMKVIAEDDQDGPIHLVHLLAACEVAAQDVRGGLPDSESIPGLFKTHGGFIVASVSPVVLPSLVRALRKDGLVGATELARKYSRRDRFRALDVLVHYVAAPIINLQIDLTDEFIRRYNQVGADTAKVPESERSEENFEGPRPHRFQWSALTRLMRRPRL